MSEKNTKDAVAEAFDKVSASGSVDPVQPTEDGSPEPAESASAPDPSVAPEVHALGERVRDPATGKFAQSPAAPTPKPPPAVAPPSPPELNPPADWKPLAREKWKALPREVQEEALRLHTETKKVLQESADARRSHQQWQQWQQSLQPYGPLLGADPLRGTLGILQTAHQLSIAPPESKAQIVASLIKGYGVPIEALAKVLDGDPGPAPQQPPQDVSALVHREFQRLAGAATQQQAKAQLTAFEDKKPEFYEHLRPLMADLIDSGIAKSLDQAYEKACKLDPQIAAVQQQRAEAKAANANSASMQAQAAATASVKSEPAGPAGQGKAMNTRDEVARQFDRVTRSRV